MTRSLLHTAALTCTLVLALVACKSSGDDTAGNAGAAAPAATGGTTATGSGGMPAAATGGVTGAAGMGSGGAAALPPGNMPNATCLMGTSGTVPACDACVCTPNAMNGCLEQISACEGGTDMVANMLCKAIIDCAGKNMCSGNACTTPCMTEISAAIMYMGTASPAPLAAATAVGTCTAKSCVGVCK